MPDERYRRDVAAYGPDVARQLQAGQLEPTTARTMQEEADKYVERIAAANAAGHGRNLEEARDNFLEAYTAPAAGQAPTLCPQCGAYWACDCAAPMPATIWGRPVRLVDDVAPATALTFETIAGEKFTIDTSDRP